METYELITCPNCSLQLESTRFCTNCGYEFDNHLYKSYPIRDIMVQSLELFGCNCDGCNNETPLSKEWVIELHNKANRNLQRVKEFKLNIEIDKAIKLLENNNYIVVSYQKYLDE